MGKKKVWQRTLPPRCSLSIFIVILRGKNKIKITRRIHMPRRYAEVLIRLASVQGFLRLDPGGIEWRAADVMYQTLSSYYINMKIISALLLLGVARACVSVHQYISMLFISISIAMHPFYSLYRSSPARLSIPTIYYLYYLLFIVSFLPSFCCFFFPFFLTFFLFFSFFRAPVELCSGLTTIAYKLNPDRLM